MGEQKILVVEDEPSIGEVVSLYLKRAGFGVTLAGDGLAALDAFKQTPPDLVVVDVMLPKMDGYELTRRLRVWSDVPIIMLTARKEEADRIAGLDMGADDYVVKPFSPQELVSRVKAVLRRTHGTVQESYEESIVFGEMKIDPRTRLATIDGKEKSLTAKEFELLWLLARHPRQVFTRDQLLERVWDTEYVDPSTVTVHIRRLREKIESDPSKPRHVMTAWGVGYKFEP
ncbi:MAG: response regulator transcription factor [Chloroflexi bacterium]|nr:response regulator transcription factor [Chloroflexota bacterium]